MSAIAAYQKYGLTPTQVHYMLLNYFHYPEEYKDTLKHYFISQYSGDYLKNQIHHGTLSKNNFTFMVVYSKCTPYTAMKAAQIKISFRVPQDEFSLCAYAVVRLVSNHRELTPPLPEITLPEPLECMLLAYKSITGDNPK